jgi:hypothetical protein
VPQNVDVVINLWMNIESFLSMDSSLSEMWSDDSEELFWRYDVVKFNPGISLAGITRIRKLAEAGCSDDVLENLRNGEDADMGLWGACSGGHGELASLIIEKYECELNWGLWGACIGGHKELALLMIGRIESSGGTPDFNQGLTEACSTDQKELVRLMIEKGATDCWCGKSLEKH